MASRAGKRLINSAQLETGEPEGPQNRCSRARETPTFSKRYALVYVKRYYLKLGPYWDGPGAAQGMGTVTPWRPRAELRRRHGDPLTYAPVHAK